MRGKRFTVPLVAVATFLVVGVGVAAAEPLTNTARYINSVSNLLLAVALPITLIVEGILVYVVWKFRKNDEAKPTKENRRLEITWTAATAVVLLFVGVAAYGAMAHPSVTATEQKAENALQDPDTVHVEITGVQWYWIFNYPEHNVTTRNTMYLPVERQIVMTIQSRDVIHAVHIPALALKKDALPGQKNYLITTVNREAIRQEPYTLYCAEFCGAGHSNMLADVYVVSDSQYQQWLQQQRQSGGNGTATNGTATNGTTTTAAANNSSAMASPAARPV